MGELNLIIYLLPIVFMIHDFEEIIFFKPWLNKNEGFIRKRFPKLSAKILPHFKNTSVPAFCVAVAEEFIILSAITIAALFCTKFYPLWVGLFMAFAVHIVIHIVQWIAIRKYIPVIITSILCLPYCIYGFIIILNSWGLPYSTLFIWCFAGISIMVVNLLLAHRFAHWFDNKIMKDK